MQERTIYRFDVWEASLPINKGSHVQSGRRPVVVVSNNMANAHSPVVTVVPLTSTTSKGRLPTHVLLVAEGLSSISLALCEQILSIDKSRLTHRIGRICEPLDRSALNRAMAIQLGMVA